MESIDKPAPRPEVQSPSPSPAHFDWRGSQTLRLLLITSLILLIQLPVSLLASLINERQQRSEEVTSEVASKWGDSQTLVGPYVNVPFEGSRDTVALAVDESGEETQLSLRGGQLFVLPQHLDLDIRLDVQRLHRGIFEVPVYNGVVELSAAFAALDRQRLGQLIPDGATPLWGEAELIFEISDPRALPGSVVLSFAGGERSFEPSPATETSPAAIRVFVGDVFDPEGSTTFASSFEMNGSQALRVAPIADESRISVGANWGDPSFQGSWLPTERRVEEKDFSAQWSVGKLARGYPTLLASDSDSLPEMRRAFLGVDLITPVDNYRLSERALKYELLFLGLVFMAVWLFEVRLKLEIHPVQYLLVGLASTLFYLLELALAEHIGFASGYLIAATMVSTMLGIYGGAILRRGWSGMALGGGCVGLYGLLFTILLNEDYALLSGSFALFGAMALVMVLTYRVDWAALRPASTHGDPSHRPGT